MENVRSDETHIIMMITSSRKSTMSTRSRQCHSIPLVPCLKLDQLGIFPHFNDDNSEMKESHKGILSQFHAVTLFCFVHWVVVVHRKARECERKPSASLYHHHRRYSGNFGRDVNVAQMVLASGYLYVPGKQRYITYSETENSQTNATQELKKLSSNYFSFQPYLPCDVCVCASPQTEFNFPFSVFFPNSLKYAQFVHHRISV